VTPSRLAAAAALAALALLGLAFPDTAQACSVCLGAREENASAFVWTTAFMGALPLLMIGGGIYWLCQRASALDAEQRAQRQAQDASLSLEPRSAS
jgi:hypothetical protein